MQSRIDKPEKQAHWAQRSLCICPTTCNRGYERERERENICHRYNTRGKSFETGIVPVARCSHPLSSALLKNSKH